MGTQGSNFVRCFRYDLFEGMDVFFSNGRRPHNRLVRFACAFEDGLRAALRARKSSEYADHAGYLTTQHGQFFASELTPRGLRENPLDDYRTRRSRIIEIYRWEGFRDPIVRFEAERYMATLRRRAIEEDIGYDWRGAVRSSYLGRRVFRRWTDDPDLQYCSENVLEVLQYFDCPAPYPLQHNPQALREWMESRSDFAPVACYELPAEG